MLRSIKKRLYWIWLYSKNISYIRENIFAVKKHFHADTISFASFGGVDINYFIKKDKQIIGVMRLALIDDSRNNGVPINRFNKKKRLEKEVSAYKTGYTQNLTPRLLYFSENCTVCSHIAGSNLRKELKRNRDNILIILKNSLTHLKKLHALEIVHLDASLDNILIDKNDGNRLKIIDFEYYPEPVLSVKEQKLYDYLRMYEYTTRGISFEKKEILRQSLSILDEVIADDFATLSLKKMQPLLNRLKSSSLMMEFLERKRIEI